MADEPPGTLDLATDNLPAVDTPDACDKAALRYVAPFIALLEGVGCEICLRLSSRNLSSCGRILGLMRATRRILGWRVWVLCLP